MDQLADIGHLSKPEYSCTLCHRPGTGLAQLAHDRWTVNALALSPTVKLADVAVAEPALPAQLLPVAAVPQALFQATYKPLCQLMGQGLGLTNWTMP